MKFVLEAIAIVDGANATSTGICRITTLQDEVGNQAVEDCVSVEAIETVLEEVSRGERGLFGEEFECQVARGGLQDYFGCWLRLEVVDIGHVGCYFLHG